MLDFGYYNLDCMVGMKEFPDKYFDLAAVDAPYGIGWDGTKNHQLSVLAKSKDYQALSHVTNSGISTSVSKSTNFITKNQKSGQIAQWRKERFLTLARYREYA